LIFRGDRWHYGCAVILKKGAFAVKKEHRMGQKDLYHPSPHWGEMSERAGEYPFTRGIYPNMYRGRHWTMRQYAGFGSAEESNERYRYLLEHGQTGLSIAFDLPTQIGLDPDHPLASGEVGKVGVSIASAHDLETLLRDIPLGRVSISMTINSTAAILLAMVLCLARRQGIAWTALRGTIQNDILKEYIARGTYIYPPASSLRITTDVLSFCCREVPNWNPISISGYHIREAGSTAVQEVAFTLANGVAYVESALDAGLQVDDFAGQLSFFFNAHSNFLEEIAKFRAARRLWARIMRERFGARNPRSCMLRFHTQTAGCTLTAQQPENNIVRVTIQALAAVLGGTQSLHTNSMDEALALPSTTAARTALRTQQILAHESGVANTADPAGGSYAIEQMTDEIEAEAEHYILKIDSMGGMLRAIERGYVQREIQESAYFCQKRVESCEDVIVGVNRFAGSDSRPIEILVVNEQVGQDQCRRLAEVRRQRDGAATQRALDRLRAAAQGRENLMPLILQAVEALATVGEISDCLREVFGVYEESVTL
jgi:methylmalonyl-CoA mutase N-terminal domain/subunit